MPGAPSSDAFVTSSSQKGFLLSIPFGFFLCRSPPAARTGSRAPPFSGVPGAQRGADDAAAGRLGLAAAGPQQLHTAQQVSLWLGRRVGSGGGGGGGGGEMEGEREREKEGVFFLRRGNGKERTGRGKGRKEKKEEKIRKGEEIQGQKS